MNRVEIGFGLGHTALLKELGDLPSSFDIADHDAKKAIETVAQRGLFRFLVPGNLGGRSLEGESDARVDIRALCMIRERLAYASPMADSIFAVQGLGSHPLVLAPDVPGREALLGEVARGTRIGAFALTEPEAGSDVASMRTMARQEGGTWLLDGEKVFISNVGIADHYIVFANVDPSLGKKGISAFLVDATASRLVLEPMRLSVEHPLGRVRMNRTPARALLWEVGKGLRLALGTLDVFRTSVGAAACGMAQRAFDESVLRVKSRVQFGKPLSDFQLTQASLADMATDLEAARLLVYRAASMKDAGHSATSEVAMAKMFATEAAQRIIDRAVQLHGGVGVVVGTVVEQLYREIRPLRIYEGTTEIQKLIIGRAVLGE